MECRISEDGIKYTLEVGTEIRGELKVLDIRHEGIGQPIILRFCDLRANSL